MKLTHGRLFLGLVLVTILSVLSLSDVYASAQAIANNASGTLSVQSGTFIAYAATSSTGANPHAPVPLTYTNAAQNFYIKNAGTLAITAITLTISYNLGTPGTPTTLLRCDERVLFTGLNTCALGTTTSITNTSGTFAISLSAQPNSWYEFQYDPNLFVQPIIGVKVSSSQLRSGGGGYLIRNRFSNLCADVWYASTTYGATVYQGTCNSGSNQLWTMVAVGSNYEFINVNSGLCLEIYGASTADGTATSQWGCNGGNNQLWTLTPIYGAYSTFTNVNSTKCLDDYGYQTGPDPVTMDQWTCGGGNNQQWTLQ